MATRTERHPAAPANGLAGEGQQDIAEEAQ